MIPTYNGPPPLDLFIEWVYVIDLDREMFYVSKGSYFSLAKIPKTWVDMLDDAERFHSSACREAKLAWEPKGRDHTLVADNGITTAVLQPLDLPGDFSSAYSDLHATLVVPKQDIVSAERPIITVARHVVGAILEDHPQLLWQAQYANTVDEFLFHEVAFILLCTCSCSPELLRMAARTQQTDEALEAPFAMLQPIGDHNRPMFASAVFQGYHLKDTSPGSSPVSTCYWLLGVLVRLNRDLVSEKSIHKAIVDCVHHGRNDGKTCLMQSSPQYPMLYYCVSMSIPSSTLREFAS
ncbi:Nn.00g032400.m01.CDS01 [Neocucurbitaria sp. VM-36]